MKKIYCLLMTLVFTIALMQTASAGVISLGTIEYENSLTTTLSGNIDLNLIHSQVSGKAITATRTYENNITIYKFKSNTIREPDWRFETEEKSFLFQDKNTGQLYKIAIDFSNLEPGKNPHERQYAELAETYTELQIFYEDLKDKYDKLKEEDNSSQELLTNMSGSLAIAERDLNLSYGQIQNLESEKKTAITNGYTNLVVGILASLTICYVFFSKKAKKLTHKPENMLRSEAIGNYSRESRIVDNEVNRGGFISDVTDLTRKAMKRARPPEKKKTTTPVRIEPKKPASTLVMPTPTEYMSPAVKAEYDELKRIEKERSDNTGI